MREAIYKFADDVPAIIAIPIRAIFILGVVIVFAGLLASVPFVWFYETVMEN